MNITRPIDGFKIVLEPNVSLMVEAYKQEHADFDRHWGDLVEYLKIVAHKVGNPLPKLGPGCRLYAMEADSSVGRPRIFIGYRALGDTVDVRLLRVSW